MIQSNSEEELSKLPGEVSEALLDWRIRTLNREKVEAKLYLAYNVEDRKATEIRALINSSDERYKSVLEEAQAESRYSYLYERLLALKKEMQMRTAF